MLSIWYQAARRQPRTGHIVQVPVIRASSIPWPRDTNFNMRVRPSSHTYFQEGESSTSQNLFQLSEACEWALLKPRTKKRTRNCPPPQLVTLPPPDKRCRVMAGRSRKRQANCHREERDDLHRQRESTFTRQHPKRVLETHNAKPNQPRRVVRRPWSFRRFRRREITAHSVLTSLSSSDFKPGDQQRSSREHKHNEYRTVEARKWTRGGADPQCPSSGIHVANPLSKIETSQVWIHQKETNLSKRWPRFAPVPPGYSPGRGICKRPLDDRPPSVRPTKRLRQPGPMWLDVFTNSDSYSTSPSWSKTPACQDVGRAQPTQSLAGATPSCLPDGLPAEFGSTPQPVTTPATGRWPQHSVNSETLRGHAHTPGRPSFSFDFESMQISNPLVGFK